MLRSLRGPLVVAVVAGALALGAWLGLARLRAAAIGDGFDFVGWEASTLPGRVLFAVGAPLRHDPPPADALARYFALSDRTTPEAMRLENVAETEIAARISRVLRDQRIGWLLLEFLPPVEFEIAAAPHILVESPRTRIERLVAEPLRPDLSRADAVALEARTEGDGTRSALVVPSGGIATFPAVVASGDGYVDTVSAAAHEWTHHYLVLYPLGQEYFASNDARTINETVADVVGDEVARIVVERWGTPGSTPVSPSAAPTVDVTAALRDLRVEVDALLARGDVGGAERRMQQVRDQLAAAGVNIRRINQAYFAWYGTYAARPESVDPIGGQVRAILQRAGSLQAFLAEVRGARTREDIARLAGAASR
jgi:hypothetical protein